EADCYQRNAVVISHQLAASLQLEIQFLSIESFSALNVHAVLQVSIWEGYRNSNRDLKVTSRWAKTFVTGTGRIGLALSNSDSSRPVRSRRAFRCNAAPQHYVSPCS